MTKRKLNTLLLILFLIQNTFAQTISMQQDSTLNNLVHPTGYKTCNLGELGKINKSKTGKQSMILIPGIGFGEEVLKDFADNYKRDYTVYSITPAGFGETPAPLMPDTSVKYIELTWTNGIVTGILNLIAKNKLVKPIIIANFVTATQVALNLSLNHADKIGKIIIIGGSPYRYYPSQKDGQWRDWENEKVLTPKDRGNLVEKYWAPVWFKTVTQKTWDDNMWTAEDYCKDSITGKKLFQQSAAVPLQVMIRYLIEWMAYDVSDQYKEIKTPTLILMPDFKELLTPSDTTNIEVCKRASAKQYLKYVFQSEAWKKAIDSGNPMIQIQTIPGTRIFMWYDNPNETFKAINNFLNL